MHTISTPPAPARGHSGVGPLRKTRADKVRTFYDPPQISRPSSPTPPWRPMRPIFRIVPQIKVSYSKVVQNLATKDTRYALKFLKTFWKKLSECLVSKTVISQRHLDKTVFSD